MVYGREKLYDGEALIYHDGGRPAGDDENFISTGNDKCQVCRNPAVLVRLALHTLVSSAEAPACQVASFGVLIFERTMLSPCIPKYHACNSS